MQVEQEMKKTLWIFGVLAVIAAALAIAMASQGVSVAAPVMQQAVAANAVKIDNFTFSPATLTVSPGTTVRWTNKDDVPHTVVSSEKAFKSSALDTDQEFTFTFAQPGTYSYFCSLHPKMTATVVVK
jgi:plastocyanin